MRTTILDIETTYKIKEDKKTDADPYTGNMLVSVGYITDTRTSYHETAKWEEGYLCFTHKDKEPTENGFDILQKVLDNTNILVGHNIKFDLKEY